VSARPMWFFICTGVFERSPGLRFGVQECGLWWVANTLWQMDVASECEHGTKKLASFGEHMKRRPSEYFDANRFVGGSTAKREELSDRYQIGVRNILWSNDFPHPEGSWPHTREWLTHMFADVPEDETRLMLGEAAVEMFGFDHEELVAVARRIGPLPSELGQDKASRPGASMTATGAGPTLAGRARRARDQQVGLNEASSWVTGCGIFRPGRAAPYGCRMPEVASNSPASPPALLRLRGGRGGPALHLPGGPALCLVALDYPGHVSGSP
jgi:hypothetical protein